MATRLPFGALLPALLLPMSGCASPFEARPSVSASSNEMRSASVNRRRVAETAESDALVLGPDSGADAYVQYALRHNPSLDAAHQRWRAAAERLPQVSALPDPRVFAGVFVDEVETRVGPQQARFSLQQTLPWPGKLDEREDAAGWAARAAWREYEAVELQVIQRVVTALHELMFLDASIAVAAETLDLLQSFEEIVRARYRVGGGSHPELVRVQVELGQLEDRVTQLRLMRPSYVAELNAALNRSMSAEVPVLPQLPARVATESAIELVARASELNPTLHALDDRIEERRAMTNVARLEGLPDFTIGIDYVLTGEAMNRSLSESGDDPILLGVGINVPLWREKYDSGVREAIARRLAVSNDRAAEENRVAAAIHRAWFEHIDANRRVRLYERTLIPKAEESLRASLSGFRGGETNFLDLLDTERTLLEFGLAAERARAERGTALAMLNTLVGEQVSTVPAEDIGDDASAEEVQP